MVRVAVAWLFALGCSFSGAPGNPGADAGAGGDGGDAGTDAGIEKWGTPELVSSLDTLTAGAHDDPGITADGEIFFCAPGNGTGQDIFHAVDQGDGTFSTPEKVTELSTSSNESTLWVSPDGMEIYFARVQSGDGDIFVATRTTPGGAFDAPVPLPGPVNAASSDEALGQVSADGLALYFASERDNGQLDLYVATRASTGDNFDNVVRLDALSTMINREVSPKLSPDELTLYFGRRPNDGSDEFEIYRATRSATDQPFSNPTPIAELNTAGSDVDLALSPDGTTGYFASDRMQASERIYRVSRTAP